MSVQPSVVVHPDEYLQHQWIFFSDTLHMHLLQSYEVSSRFKIQNGRLIAIFVCSNWQNIWKSCPSGLISLTPMNISSRYCTHALTNILPWILCSFVRIKLKMAHLLPFLFAQIDNYLKMLSVQMNISNTNEYFFQILYTCIYFNPPMNYVKYHQDHIKNGRLITI